MAQITLNSSGVASDGALVLQSNGTTTAVTIDANQRAAFVAGTAALPAITTTGDTNTGIFFPAADTIAFSEGGVESARIDASGNVGIGVTPSAWSGTNTRALDISLWTSLANGNAFGTALTFNGFYNGTNWIYKQTNTASRYEQDGPHRWYTAASGTAGNTISFTQAMTLDASGNLGIGTTSPASATRLTLDYPGFAQMLMRSSGTDRISLYGDASVSAVDGKANPLAFYAGSAERARIDTSGNLLVGTAGGGGTQVRWPYNSASANSRSWAIRNDWDAYGDVAFIQSTTQTGTTFANKLSLDANGYFKCIGLWSLTGASAANLYSDNTGQVFRSTSALKYKKDIRDLENIDINLLRPIRYKSKCEMDDQTIDHFGIVADEAHDAGLTELVNYGADSEVEGFQYERLTVVLLKAMQTLKADLDATKAELAALKGTA